MPRTDASDAHWSLLLITWQGLIAAATLQVIHSGTPFGIDDFARVLIGAASLSVVAGFWFGLSMLLPRWRVIVIRHAGDAAGWVLGSACLFVVFVIVVGAGFAQDISFPLDEVVRVPVLLLSPIVSAKAATIFLHSINAQSFLSRPSYSLAGKPPPGDIGGLVGILVGCLLAQLLLGHHFALRTAVYVGFTPMALSCWAMRGTASLKVRRLSTLFCVAITILVAFMWIDLFMDVNRL